MKRMCFLVIFCFLFCGCQKESPPPAVRVVTGVQVEFHRDGQVLQRNYSSSETVQAMLNYLRLLRPFGPVIPEPGNGDGCRITLRYSHGPDTVYLQQGNEYLCRNGGDWESIDHNKATLLYPMLLLLPSDE